LPNVFYQKIGAILMILKNLRHAPHSLISASLALSKDRPLQHGPFIELGKLWQQVILSHIAVYKENVGLLMAEASPAAFQPLYEELRSLRWVREVFCRQMGS
jgi:hypothetical protein